MPHTAIYPKLADFGHYILEKLFNVRLFKVRLFKVGLFKVNG